MNEAVAQAVGVVTTVLTVGIIVRALLSWFPISPGNPLSLAAFHLTEPLLGPIRRVLPRAGMFDFSPIVALLLLLLIRTVVQQALS
ncbi:MAG: YggT family protein [Chloroflexi bacterium]|nr:YggT family protein [Chloroflexota bacterium]